MRRLEDEECEAKCRGSRTDAKKPGKANQEALGILPAAAAGNYFNDYFVKLRL